MMRKADLPLAAMGNVSPIQWRVEASGGKFLVGLHGVMFDDTEPKH